MELIERVRKKYPTLKTTDNSITTDHVKIKLHNHNGGLMLMIESFSPNAICNHMIYDEKDDDGKIITKEEIAFNTICNNVEDKTGNLRIIAGLE
jgi:hypothetical protein